MAKVQIRLDRKGMAAMLNSAPVSGATAGVAGSVRGNASGETADGDPVTVEVRSRTASGGGLSARTAYDVMLAHPAGLRIEAKRGTLARAAGAAGLEVRSRSAVG